MRLIIALIGLVYVSVAGAASIVKCVSADGKVTFSQHGCSAGSEQDTITVLKAPRPSGDGPAVKLAEPSTQPEKPRARRRYNHCGDLTQVDIAYLNGRGEIQVGMTADDVRRSIGSPSSINRASYGDQWVYVNRDGSQTFLYIDPDGCFTAWN